MNRNDFFFLVSVLLSLTTVSLILVGSPRFNCMPDTTEIDTSQTFSANEVAGKVMFSHVSVCLGVGG